VKIKAAANIVPVLILALALAAGCASSQKAAEPAPGPQIKAGLNAVMPPVKDMRYWPPSDAGLVNPNVHVFAPRMTSEIKRGLLKSGLFAYLPAPGEAKAARLSDKLEVTVNQFGITKLGSNPWVMGAYLLDGLVLPVYAVANLGTKGQMDLGTYVLPSSIVGTSINAEAEWYVKGLKDPILKRAYLVQVELGTISERKLWGNLSDQSGFGVEAGKAEGLKALEKLVQAISRDPHWSYLNQFQRLARAKTVAADETASPEAKLEAALSAVALLRPLKYSPFETKNLLDSALTPAARAGVVNEQLARDLGLADTGALPAAKRLDAKKAKALFDDPALGRSQVEAKIAGQVIEMALVALAPPVPKKKVKSEGKDEGKDEAQAAKAEAPAEAPAEAAKPAPLSPRAQRLAEDLRDALTAALKGQRQLQSVLLAEADKSIGPSWPSTKDVLSRLQASAQVKSYLARRTS
jgi:hypothetical protein